MKFLLVTIGIFFSTSVLTQTFTPITQSIINTFHFAEISEANNVAIIGGSYVSKSLDGGYTWNQMPLGAEGLPMLYYEFVGGVIIDPSTYVLIGRDDLNNRAKIIRTTDGGNTWSNVYETAAFSNSFLTHIIYNGSAVVVAAKDGVMCSADQGATWSFVPVNGGYMNSLNYNTTTNSIIANYSVTGTFRESTDDGASWTFISLPSIQGVYTHVSNQNGNYFLTQSSPTTKCWFTLDAANNSLDTIVSTSDLLPYAVEESFLLPNGRVIARMANSSGVYNIDHTNGNTFIYNYYMQEAGGSYVDVTYMDVDQTYGLLVGQMGAVTRFDLTSAADIYLPPTFVLMNAQCPGNTITADADYTYADSTVWYYDGNYIATDTSLSYVTPNTFGSFDLVMQNWVNGNFTADTTTITFQPLAATPQYTTAVSDTTPCYNSAVYFSVIYGSGLTNGSTVEIWQGNNLIYGPNAAGTGNVNLWTAPFTADDTLYTIIKRPQTCGTTYDTLTNFIQAGDYLSDNYTLLTTDSVICTGEYAQFELINTDSSLTYSFEMTNTYNGTTWSADHQGVNNDTLVVQGQVFNTLGSYYGLDDLYSYYTLSISDTNGCSESFHPFDTIVITNPSAIYYSHSQNYYRNDTLLLSNAYIKDNRSWSASPGGLTVQNSTDTIPVIFGDTIGFYDLSLTNTPVQGCANEMVRTVQLCDTLPLDPTSLCWALEDANFRNLSRVELDPFGNTYELGVFKAYPTVGSQVHRPGYYIIKRDPSGNVLWEKKADASQFSFYVDGVVIEAIDFDENGDVICGMWIQSDHPYTQELISFNDISPSNETRLYVLKLDGQTGDMIWAQDLTNTGLPFANPSTSTRYRISDILVSDQHIYVGVNSRTLIMMLALDLQGNYISQQSFSGAQFFTPNSYHIPNGSNGDDRESFLAFRFDEYSTGEIACALYYTGKPYYAGSALTALESIQTNALLVMKYTEADGFYDFEKVAHGLNTDIVYSKENTPMFVLDNEDNMTIAVSWSNVALQTLDRDTVWIKDSAFVSIGASFVFQLDTSFNLNWVSRGNYTEINDLDIAEATGDIYLAGKTNYNVGFGTGDQHRMAGRYGDYPNEYGTNPYDWVVRYDYRLTDQPFSFRFSKDGEPLSGRYYDVTELSPQQYLQLQIKNAVTPCGEMITYLNRRYNINADTIVATHNGMQFGIDSMYILKYTYDCAPGACAYMEIDQDTVIFCSGSNTATVSASSFYSVDSVAYDLLDNGVLVQSDTVLFSNGDFNVSLPSGVGNYSVVIHSPVSDTVFLTEVISNVSANSYVFDTLVCVGDLETITPTDPANIYVWNDTVVGQSYNFSSDTTGTALVSVIAQDVYGCSQTDTLQIEVINSITPTFDTLFNISCDSLLVISFNDADYFSESWSVNGSSTGNSFSQANLNAGLNAVQVELTDTNSCVVSYPLTILYTAPIDPMISSSYAVSCDDTLEIVYDSLAFNSVSWTLNGVPVMNSFYADNLNPNPSSNLLTVDLIDTNNCTSSVAVDLDYFPPVVPTFASSYSVECAEQFVVPFNSNAYSSQNWTVNGSASTNSFSSVNLNDGLNAVTVELTDFNGCTETYQIEIDFCYDLGLSNHTPLDLRVSTNPFNNYFELTFNNASTVNIKLFDLSGQLLIEQNDITSGERISVLDLSSGFYSLQVSGQTFEYRVRIVKL